MPWRCNSKPITHAKGCGVMQHGYRSGEGKKSAQHDGIMMVKRTNKRLKINLRHPLAMESHGIISDDHQPIDHILTDYENPGRPQSIDASRIYSGTLGTIQLWQSLNKID
jgi:hypothetical protein